MLTVAPSPAVFRLGRYPVSVVSFQDAARPTTDRRRHKQSSCHCLPAAVAVLGVRYRQVAVARHRRRTSTETSTWSRQIAVVPYCHVLQRDHGFDGVTISSQGVSELLRRHWPFQVTTFIHSRPAYFNLSLQRMVMHCFWVDISLSMDP